MPWFRREEFEAIIMRGPIGFEENLPNVTIGWMPDGEESWARLWLSTFTMAGALATVVLFVWLAKYYVDHGAPTQGAAIIGALAAVVTASVGGRILSDRRNSGEITDSRESPTAMLSAPAHGGMAPR